jgi:tRNA A37 threonylcarbamoyladenosine modification protein TsaB
MMLYVNGSDIARLVLGVLNDDRSAFLVDPKVFDVSPEQFLSTVDTFLGSYTLPPTPHTLTGIVSVLGPGSATALRTSLTMVNTFAFAKSIPVFGVELARGADDRSVLVGLHDVPSIPMARPVYANPANITVSTKDALGRR